MGVHSNIAMFCAGSLEVGPLIVAAVLAAAGLVIMALTIASSRRIDRFICRAAGVRPGSMRAPVIVLGVVLGTLVAMLSPLTVILTLRLCA